jgi:hypothetical protein
MNQQYAPKQITLRPSDVVVALQLALTPGAQFKNIAESTAISAGECHNAVRRLRLSLLLLPDERRPSVDALHEFLVHGAPYAFPPVLGPQLPGLPTAHASPVFTGIVESGDVYVWPHADGPARGQSLIPLHPGASLLPSLNEPLYDLLSIADALRVGTTRVRKIAADLLRARLAETNR